MTKVAFVMTGPTGGQLMDMPDEDLAKAVKDGWAIDFEIANLGGDPDPFRGHNTEPHEKAEAYLAKRGLYKTREMVAAPPGTSDPAPKKEPPAAEPEKSEPEKETAPAKGKPGRPPKK